MIHSLGKDIIVIPTHVSGLRFLENLLQSFRGYKKYPILLVINQYRAHVAESFAPILRQFADLPITVAKLERNAFELGGLYAAFHQTDAENFFLLPHSCELLSTDLFDLVFEKHKGRSVVAFPETIRGDKAFWNSHTGKYRRVALRDVKFESFLPKNIYEATHVSELIFTSRYNHLEVTAAALVDAVPKGEIVEKFGKKRLRIATPHLIKWKTHWTSLMLLKDFPRDDIPGLVEAIARLFLWKAKSTMLLAARRTYNALRYLKGGWGWRPNFYRWLRIRRDVATDLPASMLGKVMRELRYSIAAQEFVRDGGMKVLAQHNLGPQSLVMDVGGFAGEWTGAICEKFDAKCIIFEPVPLYYGKILRRFENNANVDARCYGLAGSTGRAQISCVGPGSTHTRPYRMRDHVWVDLKDVADVFQELDGRDVDVIKLNIEGAEYEVLQRMAEADLLKRCKRILVQFHAKYQPRRQAMRQRAALIAAIERTHRPTFSYPFVWEGWKRRDLDAVSDA